MDLKGIEAQIDKWLKEIKETTDEIRADKNITLQKVFSHSDRWDSIRTDAFLMRQRAWRKCQDAKDVYEDGMRSEMVSAGRRSQLNVTAYDERKASYETKNLVARSEYRAYERVLTQLDDLLKFLRDKERWLEARRINLHSEAKREHFHSARETYAVD